LTYSHVFSGSNPPIKGAVYKNKDAVYWYGNYLNVLQTVQFLSDIDRCTLLCVVRFCREKNMVTDFGTVCKFEEKSTAGAMFVWAVADLGVSNN
jgi:hypothetical protein